LRAARRVRFMVRERVADEAGASGGLRGAGV
jgi:hypothetical protein